MKKILTILGAAVLSASSSVVVVSCSQKTKQLDISTIIKQTDIGIINDSDEESIKRATLDNNPNLKSSDFEINNIIIDTKIRNSLTGKAILNGKGDYKGNITISFVIVPALKDVLINSDLGIIDSASEQSIKKAVYNKNPNIDILGFKVDYITSNSAEIIGDDITYNGVVYVSFTTKPPVVKPNLNTGLTITNLGDIENNNSDTIKKAILNKNPKISSTDITVWSKTQTSAVINSTSTGKYKGSVTVSFVIKPIISKPNLNTVLKNTNLGVLENNNSETIKQAILNKNSEVSSTDINITNITLTTAVANATSSGKYIGNVDIKFTVDEKIPQKQQLEEVIKIKDIGTLPNANSDLIIEALVKVNPKLNKKYVMIYENGFNSESGWGWAKVKSIDENVYVNPKSGAIDLIFHVDQSISAVELSTVITNTNLGIIQKLDETTIKQKIKTLNPKVETNYIDIKNITNSQANVTSNDLSIYKGTVNVKYQLDTSKAVPLSSVLKITDLGELISSDENTIKQAIKQKNTEIDVNAIAIDSNSITSKSALVKSIDPTKYSGNPITVNYKLNTSSAIDLKTVISNTYLKGISDNLDSGIKRNVIKFNSSKNIDQKDLKITNKTNEFATIESNNLTKYKGSVNVQYEIKTLVGYHYDWGGQFEKKIELNDKELLDSSYNVINLSFLYSTIEYAMPTYTPNNPSVTKEGIKALQKAGKRVLISMGGATAEHMKFRYDQKEQLKNSIRSTIDEYGFDGLDIDWESTALASAESKEVTAYALKELKEEYKTEGKDFIITMAPEFPYLRKNHPNSYKQFLKILDGYYDWINPQFYNGWGDGAIVETQEDANKTGVSLNTYITNDNVEKRGEFYYLMAKYMTSKPNNINGFYQIPSDKFIIGASTNEPAGRGAGSKASFNKAYSLLNSDSIQIRGLMTWSILWDAFEGKIPTIYGGTNPEIMWYRWSYSKWFDESFGKLKNQK